MGGTKEEASKSSCGSRAADNAVLCAERGAIGAVHVATLSRIEEEVEEGKRSPYATGAPTMLTIDVEGDYKKYLRVANRN